MKNYIAYNENMLLPISLSLIISLKDPGPQKMIFRPVTGLFEIYRTTKVSYINKKNPEREFELEPEEFFALLRPLYGFKYASD